MSKQKPLCEIANCPNVICGKKILIQDYGQQGKWLADVCKKHYDAAHPSRKD